MRTLMELSFDGLAKLDDEKVSKMLLFHLQRIAQDCVARPGEKAKRKVTLEFLATPLIADDGGCESAHITVEVKSKIPTHHSKPYEMEVNNKGFRFNEDFPQELDSQSLFPNGKDET